MKAFFATLCLTLAAVPAFAVDTTKTYTSGPAGSALRRLLRIDHCRPIDSCLTRFIRHDQGCQPGQKL